MLGAEWGTLFVSSLFLAFLPGQGTNLEDEPRLGRRQPATLQPSAPMVVCCPLVGAEGTVTTWLPLGGTLPSGRKIDPYYENQCRTRPRLTEQPKPLHLKAGGICMDQQCFPPKDADCSPPSPFRSCSASLVELWLSGTCPGDTHARKHFLKPTQILSLHHGV